MSEQYNEFEWKEFGELYLSFRKEGKGQKEAYGHARSALVSAGKRCPSFRTFLNRLYNRDRKPIAPGVAETVHHTRRKVEVQEPEPEVEVEAETPAPEVIPDVHADCGSDPGLGHLEERMKNLEMLVKLYRFRREEDCDAVCDALMPELLEEVQR